MQSRLIKNRGERLYAQLLEKRGVDYIYPCLLLRLPTGERWRPDFYLPDQNTYIEVIAQASAYYSRKEKMAKAGQTFKVRILSPDGKTFKLSPIRRAKRLNFLRFLRANKNLDEELYREHEAELLAIEEQQNQILDEIVAENMQGLQKKTIERILAKGEKK